MKAYQLANGNFVVPHRAETDGIIGDALHVIGPSHPDYKGWQRFVILAPEDIEAHFGAQKPEPS